MPGDGIERRKAARILLDGDDTRGAFEQTGRG